LFFVSTYQLYPQSFFAQISIGQQKQEYLGSFPTPKEAAISFDRAVYRLKKGRTLLNFPKMKHTKEELKNSIHKKRKINVITNGFRGVSQNGNKFRAMIKPDKKTISLGRFCTVEEAAKAFDLGLIQYGKDLKKLNYPKSNYTNEIKKNSKSYSKKSSNSSNSSSSSSSSSSQVKKKKTTKKKTTKMKTTKMKKRKKGNEYLNI